MNRQACDDTHQISLLILFASPLHSHRLAQIKMAARSSSSILFLALLSLLALTISAQVHLPLAPIPRDTFHFVSLGDWGSVNKDQAAVAEQIGYSVAAFNASVLLAVGDNFYEDGVANDTDPQWQTSYRDVYTNTSLDIPWYAILGNHDHHLGRGQGEIDYYTNKRDNRWYCPSYWYDQTWLLQDSNVTVHMVFIDTVILSGDDNATWPKEREEQYAWINATLAASTADWLIVVGHYPVYSSGEHGNTADLDTNLKPMLQQYAVDMYLCGHDHTLQHLQESANTTQYFVSGNGAKRGDITPIPQQLFGVVDPGFMLHSVHGRHEMSTAVVDYNGKTIYHYAQKRLSKPWEQQMGRVAVANVAME